MTTTTQPDVPLPAGAFVIGDWGDMGDGARLIATETKEVEGADVGVSIDAPQRTDGSLVRRRLCSPRVLVYKCCDHPDYEWQDCLEMPAEAARKLARALVEAADQLDGWAR